MTVGTSRATAAWTRGAAAGLVVQVVLLAVLAATAGLTTAGWVAGLAYGVVLCGVLAAALHRAGMIALGPAGRVTFGRALMVGGVTAMVVSAAERPVHRTLLITVVAVALALDGVDGRVARRTGTSSSLGARFDMEVDAFLILVLSVFVAGTLGWWTVAIGALRYALLAASWALPWLTGELPPRFSRKLVAATQGVVLVVAAADILPYPPVLAAVVAALASLAWSFGRDVAWLWRTDRARRAAARPGPPTGPRRRAADPDDTPLRPQHVPAG